jgi:hypothetical protein
MNSTIKFRIFLTPYVIVKNKAKNILPHFTSSLYGRETCFFQFKRTAYTGGWY